jgi:hypothetical protein
MSHFGGVDSMEKKKIQRDANSGNEILTYIQNLEKMTFTKGYQKSDPSQKFTKPKEKEYQNDQ